MVLVFQGDLRYKTITSQNVPSKVQIKNFFYFVEKLCVVLKIFKFCIFNHPMMYRVSDVTMSISA